MSEKQFLDVAELSARWDGKISVRTLGNWRTGGQGPKYVKVGGRVVYRVSDIIEWEESRTVSSTSQYRRT